jgi:hypothetical protein
MDLSLFGYGGCARMPENKKWETPHLESIEVEKKTTQSKVFFTIESFTTSVGNS